MSAPRRVLIIGCAAVTTHISTNLVRSIYQTFSFLPFYIIGIYGRKYDKVLYHILDEWKAVTAAAVATMAGMFAYSVAVGASFNDFDESSLDVYTKVPANANHQPHGCTDARFTCRLAAITPPSKFSARVFVWSL